MKKKEVIEILGTLPCEKTFGENTIVKCKIKEDGKPKIVKVVLKKRKTIKVGDFI